MVICPYLQNPPWKLTLVRHGSKNIAVTPPFAAANLNALILIVFLSTKFRGSTTARPRLYLEDIYLSISMVFVFFVKVGLQHM